MRGVAKSLGLACAAWIAAGCALAPVDLRGRACPCATGWVCAAGVCVPSAELDATRLDAGPVDAGPDDAGAREDDASAPLDAQLPAVDASDAQLDAGTDVDAGPDDTHCDDLYADALFCDGFEFEYPASRGAWDWELVTAAVGSLATVSTPTPRIGGRALAATISAASGRAALGADLAAPITDGELWLRGWYYLPSELAIDGLSLLYVGSTGGAVGISFQTHGGGQAAVWIGTISSWRGTTVPIPRDTWACLQLHVIVSETDGAVEMFVDDFLIARHAAIDTLPIAAGGFGVVEAGIEYSNDTQTPGTLYVDEVVLSRTRVACD